MARRPRKVKIKPIVRLWDMDESVISKVIDHLKKDFPLSGMLIRYEAELKRREDGVSVDDFYKIEDEE